LDSPAKKTYGDVERDDVSRKAFLQLLEGKARDSLVFVDESGISAREDYPYGWCDRSERFYALKSGRRKPRVSIVAALRGENSISPLTFEGAGNRNLFESWVEQQLLPVLKAGQIVILDNPSFQKGGRIEELIKSAGCDLLYLLPYSPDFNPIERCWAKLKNYIWKALVRGDQLRKSVDAAVLAMS
jgi:transposase